MGKTLTITLVYCRFLYLHVLGSFRQPYRLRRRDKHSPLTEIKQQNNQKITQKTRTRNPISSTLEVSSVFFLNFAAIVTALFTLNFEF